MADPVVAREVAELELERFLTSMDLTVDPGDLSEEVRASRQKQVDVVLDAIMRGMVTIDGDGQPIFVPRIGDTSPITFYEPDGSSLLSSNAKQTSEMQRFFGLVASMTRQPAARFAKMKMRDFRVVQAIALLFLS